MTTAATNSQTTTINNKRWHAHYPELGTEPVPIEPYISPDYFALERERIFRHVWLNVGREEEIPQPGNYLVKDLAVCNTSIVVIRGSDGKVRAFHNICSHRGNKLVWNGRGSCQALACKFHGWTYNTKGQLTFVPDEANFFALDKEEHGLTPVATDTWEGFIFIHLDPQPTESLQEYLGELGAGLHGYPFAEFSATCYSWTMEVCTNWKTMRDAFQEVYHLASLHKRSLPSFTSPSNPFSHVLDFTLYPRHHRMSIYGNPDYHPTAVEALTYRCGDTLLRPDYALERLPVGVNPSRDPCWAIDINLLFPNFQVHVFESTFFTLTMWPLAVDRTLWEIRSYFPRAATAGQRFSQEYSNVFLRDVFAEDVSTMEQTQSVLASGAKTHFILQDEELLIRHDHKVREELLGFYRGRDRDREKNGKGVQANV